MYFEYLLSMSSTALRIVRRFISTETQTCTTTASVRSTSPYVAVTKTPRSTILARMLESGENPLYVGRRLIRIASEDVGLAAPESLPMAVSVYQAAHFIGMSECDVVLAHVATMLARAPKSVEVYSAYKRAKQSIQEWNKGPLPDVPLHLRNAPTKLMKKWSYGKEYKYNPHYTADELKDQTYLPDEMIGTNFFEVNDANKDRS